MSRFTACALLVALLAVPAALAEDSSFDFQAGINLGTDVIPDPDSPTGTSSWTRLGFQPDLSFGDFGIGIDLSVRFKLYPDPDTAISIYPGDWIPDYQGNGKNFLDLYLPKFMYVRYREKGDPLYAKLGSIDDLTLGDGFIVGGYSNMLFMPEYRVFGLEAGIDGTLFGFPFVGFEFLTGNVARLDVIGGRFFVRPLAASGIPIVEAMQVGLTGVIDRAPYLYDTTPGTIDSVVVYGADVFAPIYGSGIFSLAAFTDFVVQPQGRWGYMLGAGGKLLGLFTYGAQLRVMGPGFIPVYFDANYDVFRGVKADVMAAAPSGDAFAGWFATIGTTLLEEKIVFRAALDGPFSGIPALATENPADYPHLKGAFRLAEGILGGFSFDASYDKYFLGKAESFWKDLVSPEDAVIGAAVNYHTGAAVISLIYNLTYNPEAPNGFDITSSLSSSIKF